jgi:hypothetical protein
MRKRFRVGRVGGQWEPDAGGITRYPLDELAQEVAYVAYHFHWPKDEIEQMSHRERHRWVKEISRINQEINEAANAS